MAAANAKSLFDLLVGYEQRSIAHDASGASQVDRENTWDGVVFRLGKHRLTVGITEVEEILPLPQAAPVPGAADWLLGLGNVRGNLVTIVDLGWFIYGTRTPITARTRLILTRLQGRHLGLIVDEVFGQRHFNVTDVESGSTDDEALERLVEQMFPLGEERWGRLQLDRLMSDSAFLDGSAR